MKVVAFGLRAAGPRNYEHAIIDLGAVAMSDGEVLGEFHAFLKPHPDLSYRPSALADAQVQFSHLKEGLDYEEGVSEFCRFCDDHRGSQAVWGFDAHDQGQFVWAGLRKSRSVYGFDRVASVNAVFATMFALGIHNLPFNATEAIMKYLGEMPLDPATDALLQAKVAATATFTLLDKFETHYAKSEPSKLLEAA